MSGVFSETRCILHLALESNERELHGNRISSEDIQSESYSERAVVQGSLRWEGFVKQVRAKPR